jgi:hypothetical protein
MTGEYNAVIKHMAGIEDKNILMSWRWRMSVNDNEWPSCSCLCERSILIDDCWASMTTKNSISAHAEDIGSWIYFTTETAQNVQRYRLSKCTRSLGLCNAKTDCIAAVRHG